MDVIILEGIPTLYFLTYLPQHDFFVIYHLKNGGHVFDTQSYRLLTGILTKIEDCEGGHKYTETIM
jgi:hypothetical protein